MVAIIILLLVCVLLAMSVMALVARSARREGLDLLGPRGEELVGAVRGRGASAAQGDA